MPQQWESSENSGANRRVLVTGGAGFLGSFVVAECKSVGRAMCLCRGAARYELRDTNVVRQVLADAKPQLVIQYRGAGRGNWRKS